MPWRCSIVYALVIAAVVAARAQGDEPAAETIFDGRSLDGWEGNKELWRVEDGAITAEVADGDTLRRNEFLFFADEVGDFELSLQYRISGGPAANSGIQYRSQRLDDGGAAGYQADLDDGQTWLGRIYDEHGRELLVERGTRVSIAPDGRKWTDEFAKANEFRQLPRRDDWNTYKIKAAGPHVEIWINNKLCAALDDHQRDAAELSGRLAFQLHSGPGPAKIEFRNVQLKKSGMTRPPVAEPTPVDPENRQSQSPVLWHLLKNPAAPTAIDNAEAQQVVADMQLVEGFQAELIAAEPDLHQPIAFAIDERGRLWVVEAFSYPNKQPEGEGKDRIRILADADGDGAFETKTTFAEGLNLVSGIEVGFGGVWLGAAPELLFIPDADGDDRPDGPPEVLLDGFGYQDTHETMNSFAWGPDGWLYGNQGVFNKSAIGRPGAGDNERVELRAGIWRYHPVRREFEVFAHGGSNQWGLDFNAAGHLFMTHCRSYWGGGGTTYVIRNGHFWNQTNSDYPAFVSNAAPRGIGHLMNFLPASARYDSGEGGAGKQGTTAIYGGHSHVGTMVYLGDNWPACYRDHVFTHNLHGHQLNHQHNVRDGSAYETLHGGYDIMYAPDPAYVAVDLQCGPDGAVYMTDWVDRQHCHNPRAEQWDRTNGRLYRVSWRDSYQPVKVDLSQKSAAELVALESHRNQWYARTARRLLQQRAAEGKLDASIVPSLRSQLDSGDEQQALAALWTLHVVGRLESADAALGLAHPSEVVREWTVRLATERDDLPLVDPTKLAALATDDPAPMVRLAVASAMPTLAAADRWRVAEALAAHGEDSEDRFLPKMIWFGLAPIANDDVPRAMALAAATPLPSLRDSIYWHAARSSAGRDAITQLAAETDSIAEAQRLLDLLEFSLQYDASLERPSHWSRVIERLADTGDEPRRQCNELSAVFGDAGVLAAMRSTLADESAPLASRRAALGVLKRVGDVAAAEVYVRLIDDDELRGEVIPLLARTPDPAAADKLVAGYESFNDAERGPALAVLTSRPEFALKLLAAVDAQSFDKKHLTALQIREMHNLGDADVTALLEKVWGKVGGSSDDAKEAIAKIRHVFTTAPLWAYSENRGREVYKKTCANCHPLDGSSVPLGPSLNGAWRNGLDYFLENIVDPNAVVGENFRMTIIETTSGQVISGMFDNETSAAVVLRTADATITIPKTDIAGRDLVDQSIMPTGLLANLSETEMIELLKFLTSKKQ